MCAVAVSQSPVIFYGCQYEPSLQCGWVGGGSGVGVDLRGEHPCMRLSGSEPSLLPTESSLILCIQFSVSYTN